jgi:indole-3-glycerol phosphate synthase
MPFKLDQILRAKEGEITAAKKAMSIGDLKRMAQDAPPLRSFKNALSNGFGVIAEIKRKSPSMGEMRSENFEQAPTVYARSPIVKAISVITDEASFGMSLDHLRKVKAVVSQPILRKDFIQTEYGVHQARAYGADAILLMGTVLKKRDTSQKLFDLATELGMDVLFEVHNEREIEIIPIGAQIIGVNSRNFMGQWRRNAIFAKTLGKFFKMPDFSTNLAVFSLINQLPNNAIKVAESGISPTSISRVVSLGYNAALIGTSLLKAKEGVEAALVEFEQAIKPSGRRTPSFSAPVPA